MSVCLSKAHITRTPTDTVTLSNDVSSCLRKFREICPDCQLGPYLLNIPKNFLCPFVKDSVNLKVTRLLTGVIVWFSQSEVVLLSNACKKS